MKELDLADIFGGESSKEIESPNRNVTFINSNNSATEEEKVINTPTKEESVNKKTKKQKVVSASKKEEKLPEEAIHETDIITVNGESRKIKPTRLGYFRNRTAAIYEALKKIPIHKFLAYEKGVFDEERDSDQILFDFLVAVFDDEDFVKKNYNNFTADDLEKILEIFGRINHIDKKEEEARKNMEAQVNR